MIQTPRIAFVRRRLSQASGLLSFAAALLPLGAFALLTQLEGGNAFLQAILDRGALAALPLAVLSYLAGKDLFGAAGSIERDGDEVVIQRGRSQRRLPLAAVEGGIIVPQSNGVLVELHLAGGNHVTVKLDDVATAEALLRELRVDVGKQRCRVQIADRAAAWVVALGTPLSFLYFGVLFIAIPFGRYGAHLPWNVIFVLCVAFYALLSALIMTLIAPPDVTVGTDGIAFRRGFRGRFVPFSDLEGVRTAGLGARLLLREGRTVLLPSIAGVSNARIEALKLRIQEAMSLRDAAPKHGLLQLDRAGRSIPEWRASLAALARRGADYRAAGLSAEDLEALLVSPDATPERRLAAAVALSASQHPTAPEHIRIAAAQCASERLRVALEKVGEGEEDDLAIAEALDEEKARSGSRA